MIPGRAYAAPDSCKPAAARTVRHPVPGPRSSVATPLGSGPRGDAPRDVRAVGPERLGYRAVRACGVEVAPLVSARQHTRLVVLQLDSVLLLPVKGGERMISFEPRRVRFELGRVVATSGVVAEVSEPDIRESIRRHHRGDWGDIDDVDKQTNDLAVRTGDERLLSAYWVPSKVDPNGEVRIYVITEADRSVTTVLLTDEY